MKNKVLMNYIAILSLFLFAGAGTFENPGVQATIEAWPKIANSTIRMMITLPSLVSTITMILVGRIVGKKISYRRVCILGAAMILIGGLVPFFFHPDWYLVLGFRALLGVGVGFFSVRNALLIKEVPVESLAKYIGYGSVLASLMTVIVSPVVGRLVAFGWQYAMLGNLAVLISVVLVVLFLQEPADDETVEEIEPVGSVPKVVYLYIFIQFLATMVLYPVLSGMSSYLGAIGIDNATIAGYMLSLYTIGGVISNTFLSGILKLFKKNTLFMALMTTALGNALIIFTGNIIMIGIGTMLSGVGFMILFSLMQIFNGRVCDQRIIAQTSTMILAASQLGVFLSSYFIEGAVKINLFEIEILNTYFICMLTYLVLGAVVFVFKRIIIK